MDKRQSPLLVFALDSANFELIEQWAEEGFLPNLKSILHSGASWQVGGPGVYDEIGAWTSVFSGVPQSEHGFHSSRRLKHGSYQLELASFDDAGVLPFWGLPGNKAIKSAILDLPEPYIVPGIRGIQLTSLHMHYEEYAYLPTRSEPVELAADIAKTLGPDETKGFGEFDKPEDYYLDQLNKNLERMKRRCDAFRSLLSKKDYDLMVIGFGETHDLGHMMWPFTQTVQGDTGCNAGLAHGLRTVYQQVDKQIGLFLDQMPSALQLMVLSVYGIKSQYPTAHLGEQLLDRLGYRVAQKKKLNPVDPLSIARKILPEKIRYKLSAYIGFKLQQKLLHDNFTSGTDWSKSRVFSIPSLYQNWFRVNLKGREPLGIVEAVDYSALLDEIEQQMRLIIDPKTGKSAISSVLRAIDPSRQDPLNNKGPDLIVHWKSSDHLLDIAHHPSGNLCQPRPHFYRNSFHKFKGFTILRGANIKPGRKGTCGILDIAPTCMDLLNINTGHELAGKSLISDPQAKRDGG